MAGVKRRRLLEASPAEVWRVVGDPHHLPRWWPRVARMEGVDDERFTQVLLTDKGKAIRADFHWVAREPERCAAWEQELRGTPFERILNESRTRVDLEPAEGGTAVTLAVDQKLKGWSRLGPFFFSGAAKRQLDEALDGLVRACG